MGLVVHPQQLSDQVLLAKAPKVAAVQHLPGQRQSVHTGRDGRPELFKQLQPVERSDQQGAVKVTNIVANKKWAFKHLKESDERDQDLPEGVGEERLAMEVQSVSADLKARHFGCSVLNSSAWDHIQVQGVTSAHCSQLDDFTVWT